MKKILSVLIASALILTAAGCGENKKPTGATTKVTETAFEAQIVDTSNEAVAYLESVAPLFVEYLKVRRSVPLVYEIEVETETGIAKAGIYIKDESNISSYSQDEAGNSSTTIYSNDKIYYIDHTTKTIYEDDVPVESSKEMVRLNLVPLDIESVSHTDYTSGSIKEFNGAEYNYETIGSGENVAEYYYDVKTNELKYIVAGGVVNKITNLSNTVNEDAFVIPDDYTRGNMDEYLKSIGQLQ